MDIIVVDDVCGGYEVVKYFLLFGYINIVCIVGDGLIMGEKNRIKGFC